MTLIWQEFKIWPVNFEYRLLNKKEHVDKLLHVKSLYIAHKKVKIFPFQILTSLRPIIMIFISIIFGSILWPNSQGSSLQIRIRSKLLYFAKNNTRILKWNRKLNTIYLSNMNKISENSIVEMIKYVLFLKIIVSNISFQPNISQ